MKISNETKVGALTIIALTILILGYNFLRGIDLFSGKSHYYAIYESIEGLNPSNRVLLNGMPVGKVSERELMPDNRILVKFNVNRDVQIPKGTIARIVSLDLLGEKSVELVLSDRKEYLISGDTLNADVQQDLASEVRREILPVKQRAEDLLSSLDSLTVSIKTIIEGGAIDKSLVSFSTAIEKLAHTASNIDSLVERESIRISSILANIESITGTLKESNQEITNIIKNFSQLSDTLAEAQLGEAIEKAKIALGEASEMLTKINSGEGTLGLLLNDKELYNNLESSASNLDKLLYDFRMNPRRYVHFSILRLGSEKTKDKPDGK